MSDGDRIRVEPRVQNSVSVTHLPRSPEFQVLGFGFGGPMVESADPLENVGQTGLLDT